MHPNLSESRSVSGSGANSATRLRMPDSRTEVISRRLGGLHALSPEERDLLLRIGAGPTHRHPLRTTMTFPGNGPRYVLIGWVACYRQLNDGRRQLFGVAIPGDGLNLRPWVNGWGEIMQAATMAQTVDAAPVQTMARTPAGSGLAAAMQLAHAEEDAFRLDQVIRLGRQTALERLSHLLLELHFRCASAGLAHGPNYPLPLTQEVVGDLLGLSVVHVNRTMQLMRRENMIDLRHGQMTLLNPDKLAEIAEFRPPQTARTGVTAARLPPGLPSGRPAS